MRSFIGIPLPGTAVNTIGPVLTAGKKTINSVKWVKPENIHITLLFLGEIEFGEGEAIKKIVGNGLSGFKPFHVTVKGIGGFPSLNAPRVLYLPVTEGTEQCSSLYAAVSKLCAPFVKKEKRKFTPHCTIGRIRKGKKCTTADISALPDYPPTSFTVGEIIMYQSVLQPDGPVYNAFAEFKLYEME